MSITTKPNVAPADRHSRHRWHWVRKNGFEVWEWLPNGSWLRPGHPKPMGEREAAALGWKYVAEARPPVDERI